MGKSIVSRRVFNHRSRKACCSRTGNSLGKGSATGPRICADNESGAARVSTVIKVNQLGCFRTRIECLLQSFCLEKGLPCSASPNSKPFRSSVVGQCNAILKGCELIAVGERCDTHGARSDLILTLKGSHLHRRFDPFRVNENVYPRSVGVASSPTATKLNPFGIPNACELQSRL